MLRVSRVLPRLLMAGLLLLSLVPAAQSIPAFARRYGISCQQCHHPIPKLTGFGEMFAGHGFRMVAGEAPTDTIGTGDELLALPKHLPLALRVDGHARLDADDDRVTTDLAAPFVIKILSSASLSSNLSYYFYFLMNERGEVAGAEDAFLYWNDVAGKPVDLALGQFQVSDPMFKRELRLSFEDYIVYRTDVGEQPANLTYDRGVMAIVDVAGFTATLELLNGNGLAHANAQRRYDNDALKNVFAHVTRDIVPGLRLGALGYAGWQDLAGAPDDSTRNTFWMAGGDATITLGPLELNGQYVHREDDRPTFTNGEAESRVDGGFVEALWMPEGSRAYGLAIWNRVIGSSPVLGFGQGAPTGREHESAAVGGGYLVRRNLRVGGEVGWDFVREQSKVSLGFTLGY